MKVLIIVAVLVAAVSAQKDAQIVKLAVDNPGTGQYAYSFETSNGIKADQNGQLKAPSPGNEEGSQVASGSYSFVADDGQTYTITYIADENGYQPQGAHLPKPQ